MNIHLLTVSSSTLEADTLRAAIDKNGTADFTAILALCQDIKETRQSQYILS